MNKMVLTPRAAGEFQLILEVAPPGIHSHAGAFESFPFQEGQGRLQTERIERSGKRLCYTSSASEKKNATSILPFSGESEP